MIADRRSGRSFSDAVVVSQERQLSAVSFGSPFSTVVVKESVASEIIHATCFSGSATVTWSSRSGLSDTVPIGVQLRVLPLHRAGLVSRAA